MTYQAQLDDTSKKLLKALRHLDYSFKKVQSLSENISELDEEGLEAWESFSARFSRVSEIFLVRYVRTVVLLDDPGFTGTLRDFVNQAEKLGVVDDADSWMGIRELRNITAHDYSESDMSAFFSRLKEECPRLIALQSTLAKHEAN